MNAQQAAEIMVNTPRLHDKLEVAETFEAEVTDFPPHPRGLFLTAIFNARRDGDDLAEMMLDFGSRLYEAQEKGIRLALEK